MCRILGLSMSVYVNVFQSLRVSVVPNPPSPPGSLISGLGFVPFPSCSFPQRRGGLSSSRRAAAVAAAARTLESQWDCRIAARVGAGVELAWERSGALRGP